MSQKWLNGFTAFFFLYALVNFGISGYLLRHGGSVRHADGTFTIENHGQFVRAISEAEFDRYQAYEARLFSGHWMLFYGVAASILASAGKPSKSDLPYEQSER